MQEAAQEFRVACRISKRTALYLLQSGLVPCETTGEKTRCYAIRKCDALAYLQDRARSPANYRPPDRWYAAADAAPRGIRTLPFDSLPPSALEAHYAAALAEYPDVLDVDDIARVTGYARGTVTGWCRKGRLRPITRSPKYWIPKPLLQTYLCSDTYHHIRRKSKPHLSALANIHQNLQKGDC